MAERFQALEHNDPRSVGGYALRARIGAGGMGAVYLSATRGGLPVAVKVMHRDFSADPEFRSRFVREIEAALRVHNRYAAQVLDAKPDDASGPWLATAYVPGPSLSYAVAEYGPLPLFSVFRLVAGVAEATESIHAAGLIHRDLKPANVVLADDGPRVIDFGIAHAVDASSITGSRHRIGTPAFMAPEQIRGDQVTEATDVWAFGHLALYAAIGRAAFGEGDQAVLFYRIVNEDPHLEDCPEPLLELVQRCLAKDPADRPSVADIRAIADNALQRVPQPVDGSWLPASIGESLRDYDAGEAPLPTAPSPSGTPHLAPSVPVVRPTGNPPRPPRRLLPSAVIAAAAVVAVALLVRQPWHTSPSGESAQSLGTGTSTVAPSAPTSAATSLESPTAAAATTPSRPTAPASPAVLSLSGVTTEIDAGRAPAFRYTAQNIPAGDTAVLQRTFGHTFKNVMTLTDSTGRAVTPPVLSVMGKYIYRIALVGSGSMPDASNDVTVHAYGNIPLTLLGGNSGTEQVASRIFSYSDQAGPAQYPAYQQNKATSVSTCRTLTMQFAGDDMDQADGSTDYLEFIQSSTDPVYASAPAGTVTKVTVHLDGGPLYINASVKGFSIISAVVFNATGSCYAPPPQS